MTIHAVDAAMIAAYLIGMIAIGYALTDRIKVFPDFFVAGRHLTTPVLICSLVSTYYGLDVLFGDAGDASLEGVSVYFLYMRPYTLGMLVAAFLVAGRFRGTDYMSLPDILARHYGRSAQVAGAIASFFYALPIMSIMGMAGLGQTIFGWPLWQGAVAGSLFAFAYTAMGGFWADAITDTVKFVIMCVSLAVLVPYAVGMAGGFDGIQNTLGPSHFNPLGEAPLLYTLAYSSTALSVLVEPAFYQRIFSARDTRTIRNAFLWGIVIWTAYDWCVVAVGLAGGALQANGTIPADLPSDQLLLRVGLLCLPVGLTGLFLGGCLSSAMSTMDSYLLIAAGNIVYDIHRPMARTPPTDRQLIRYIRWTMLASGAVCIAIGLYFDRIKEAWVFMSSILTSTCFIPVLGAMFLRGPRTPASGSWSAVGGLAAVLLFYSVLEVFGVENEELSTIQVEWNGIVILREYALFFALPVSALGFLAGNLKEGGR